MALVPGMIVVVHQVFIRREEFAVRWRLLRSAGQAATVARLAMRLGRTVSK